MSTTTPLTDAINALITYSNEVTGSTTDDTLSECVATLVAGYGSGETASEPLKDVNFFDYDGTVLYSYSASDFLALTSMPANPSHSGLTAQGWNWTLSDAQAQVTATGVCDIGQLYVTSDGATRVYFHLEDGRLSPYLGIAVNGTVTVDWGDGSTNDTVTGTSTSSVIYTQHTYSTSGDYVISLSVTDGSFSIVGNNFTCLIAFSTTSSNEINVASANSITKLNLGNNVSIGPNGLRRCLLLKYVTIPSSAFISTGAFYSSGIECAVLPSGVDTRDIFNSCNSLELVSLPKSLTTIGNNFFRGVASLKRLVIPNGVTTIGSVFCYSANSLRNIVIPSSVTSFSGYEFYQCYTIAKYHFLSTSPPTISNTAFNQIRSDVVIYVPQGCLEAYQTADNWSAYASYMQEEN